MSQSQLTSSCFIKNRPQIVASHPVKLPSKQNSGNLQINTCNERVLTDFAGVIYKYHVSFGRTSFIFVSGRTL